MSRTGRAIAVALLVLGGSLAIGRVALAQPVIGKEADEEESDGLEPGLVAAYRSLDPGSGRASLSRIEPKPAFLLGESSTHPRIPPGPFEVVWTGVLEQTRDDTIRLGAFLGGSVAVSLDGVTVLKGLGHSETSWVESSEGRTLPRGTYPLRIVYRSLPGVSARLQLWWEGATFSREPIPAWRLKHRSAEVPGPVRAEELATRGRVEIGRMGCARCHRSALPAVSDPPPGPSLETAGRRLGRTWLLDWLENPPRVREGARMPVLFTPDRQGFVERSIVADRLLKTTSGDGARARPEAVSGNVQAGRSAFLGLGCFACHPIPDKDRAEPVAPGLFPIKGLNDRMPMDALIAFLGDPRSRYPDGRMPRLPVAPGPARDIAAYLRSCSAPSVSERPDAGPITTREIDAVARRLGVDGREAVGPALLREKRCLQCHSGLGEATADDIPIRQGTRAAEDRGCLSERTLPRFALAPEPRRAILAYLTLADQERYPSPFDARQQTLRRAGCFQCHERDSERLAPLEEEGSRIVQHDLIYLPGQRTPRLTNVLSKYRRTYVVSAIRDGVSGVRPPWYSYRMPAFGAETEAIVRALAEGDGDLVTEPEPVSPRIADPELPAQGPNLVGSAGYSCVACHLWKGRNINAPEPGAAGPELTTVPGRIRRDYFDRWLDEPSRVHPRTPMPQIFRKGQPAVLSAVLGGDSRRQKDALWSYFSLGARAPDPTALPPTPVPTPAASSPPLVAQVPIHLPDNTVVESLCVLHGSHDALIYDIGRSSLRDFYTGAQILRIPKDRRSFALAGTPVGSGFSIDSPLHLVGPERREVPLSITFAGYDRLPDGVRVRSRARFASGPIDLAETLRIVSDGTRQLLREFRFEGVPPRSTLEFRTRAPAPGDVQVTASTGEAEGSTSEDVFVARFVPDAKTHAAAGTIRSLIPPAHSPIGAGSTVPPPSALAEVAGTIEGEHEQPGYRAIAYPRPRTAFGEDRVMPGAIVANPRDGRVYIASMKMGELFVLNDPNDDGKGARFDDFGGGLFQDAYAMAHDGEALYLLHRRNLTRIRDLDRDGVADSFDRLATLTHSVTENIDNAYGLVREPSGAFVFTYAVNTSQKQPGWGSVLRLTPGENEVREELAFGMRRAFGWCLGPENEVFFTDNQGEWVASNKLCHVEPGRYFGYPNPGQEHHLKKPAGKAAVWVPYAWAVSTNGLVFDTTGGKFGPFAGQFFMAGWTERGGIIRAQVEKVNGVYQGTCFPFWGNGMLGPLVLAFDPKGRLFVGGITEGTCGAHPDRGALFRIDFTGRTPFEIQTIHVQPRGFRLVFTTPADPRSALDPASYALEHFRYAYSAEYGSPELDRARLAIVHVKLSDDRRAVELETAPLIKDRVYLIQAGGVRSGKGEALVHPEGAYTLNEIPAPAKSSRASTLSP